MNADIVPVDKLLSSFVRLVDLDFVADMNLDYRSCAQPGERAYAAVSHNCSIFTLHTYTTHTHADAVVGAVADAVAVAVADAVSDDVADAFVVCPDLSRVMGLVHRSCAQPGERAYAAVSHNCSIFTLHTYTTHTQTRPNQEYLN